MINDFVDNQLLEIVVQLPQWSASRFQSLSDLFTIRGIKCVFVCVMFTSSQNDVNNSGKNTAFIEIPYGCF